MSLVLAALLSVAAGHPLSTNTILAPILLYPGHSPSLSVVSVPSPVPPANGVPSTPHAHVHTSRTLAPSGYTHEVELARKQFQRAFDEAAARAAAAPHNKDLYVNTGPSTHSAMFTNYNSGDRSSGVLTTPKYAKEADQVRSDFRKAIENTYALGTFSPDIYVNSVPLSHAQGPSVVAVNQPPHTYNGAETSGRTTTSRFTQEADAARREFLGAYEQVPSGRPTYNQIPNHRSDGQISTPDFTSTGHPETFSFIPGVISPSGFTPEVEKARKEFMKAYDAAVALAAKTPDYSAVTHTATAQTSEQGAGLQPLPEVAKAMAEFMAAWNAAAARVATIEAKLVKSSPAAQATITIPEQTKTAQEIKSATEEFVAAWNVAVQRTPIVQQAVSSDFSKPSKSTEEVQRTTADLMAAWQAAARRAPKIEQAIFKATSHSTGAPQRSEAMAEVQRATAEFMAAWNAATTCVPKIETAMYSVAQPAIIGGTKKFLNLFKLAEQKAVQTSSSAGPVPVGVDVGFTDNVSTAIAYAGATASSPETVATLKSFPLTNRLFAPVQGLPIYYNCKC